jgi:membrane dipeptidase
MLEKLDNFLFVHSVEDIERVYKGGKYAVIWNNQTSTVIDVDLTKIATLKAMGLSVMQLVYNGTYRAGDGIISYLHGTDPWGEGD